MGIQRENAQERLSAGNPQGRGKEVNSEYIAEIAPSRACGARLSKRARFDPCPFRVHPWRI